VTATIPYLDQLRGHYMNAPRWVQSTGGRVLSALPPRLLYGRTFRDQLAMIEHSEGDAEFVEREVRRRLARLWAAARTTPYYRPVLDGLGVDSPTLTDLARLPVLTKEEVRRNTDAMLVVPKSELDEVMTGATSTGSALSVYLDKDRSVKEWAFLTHLWSRCGYRPGDRLAVLGFRGMTHVTDPATRPWVWEPGTRELRLSPLRLVPSIMDRYLDLAGRFRVAFFYGYPSALAILAAHARNVGWSPPASLKGVLFMSESVRPFQREVIAEGFGPIPTMAAYGLSEKVAIAGEVPGRPDEYEFEPLYGVAELVDPARRPIATAGEQGTLVGTGFVSFGMPLLRYDTGDLATFVEAPSAANRWRLRVRDIVGHYWQEYMVTREGGLITPTVLYPNNRLVREFMFVQDEPGVVTVLIVPEDAVGRGRLEPLLDAMTKRGDGLMSVRLQVVDEIPPTPRGKRVLVEQHLDLADYGLIYD
jgi:phenylacetate-CoA ligase